MAQVQAAHTHQRLYFRRPIVQAAVWWRGTGVESRGARGRERRAKPRRTRHLRVRCILDCAISCRQREQAWCSGGLGPRAAIPARSIGPLRCVGRAGTRRDSRSSSCREAPAYEWTLGPLCSDVRADERVRLPTSGVTSRRRRRGRAPPAGPSQQSDSPAQAVTCIPLVDNGWRVVCRFATTAPPVVGGGVVSARGLSTRSDPTPPRVLRQVQRVGQCDGGKSRPQRQASTRAQLPSAPSSPTAPRASPSSAAASQRITASFSRKSDSTMESSVRDAATWGGGSVEEPKSGTHRTDPAAAHHRHRDDEHLAVAAP